MINIFIANLDWEITSEDLRATFSAFGSVSYAHVVYDKDTKKSKGFGYVEMDDADEAISAIQALKGLEVNGRALDVKVASPKGNRPAPKQAEEQKPYVRDGGFKKKEVTRQSTYVPKKPTSTSVSPTKRPRTRVSEAQKVERKSEPKSEE